MYAVGNRVNDSSRSATAALGVGTNFSAAHNQYLVGTKTVTSVNGVFNFSGNSPCSHLCKLTISHDGYIVWFAFTLCRVDSDATEHVQFQPHVHRVHCGVLNAQRAVHYHWYDMHVLSECMTMHPASVAIPSAVPGADQHHCAACSKSHLLTSVFMCVISPMLLQVVLLISRLSLNRVRGSWLCDSSPPQLVGRYCWALMYVNFMSLHAVTIAAHTLCCKKHLRFTFTAKHQSPRHSKLTLVLSGLGTDP